MKEQIDGIDLAVLSCYRNKHYADGNATEQGVIANAINEVLPILVSLKNESYRKQSVGEWERRTFIIFDSEKVGYRCSECNTTWDTPTPYCPNCGAHMKEGIENG